MWSSDACTCRHQPPGWSALTQRHDINEQKWKERSNETIVVASTTKHTCTLATSSEATWGDMNQFGNHKCAASALFSPLCTEEKKAAAGVSFSPRVPPAAPLLVMGTKVIPLISNIFDYETFFSPPKRQKKNAARGIIIQSIQGAWNSQPASSDGEHGAGWPTCTKQRRKMVKIKVPTNHDGLS